MTTPVKDTQLNILMLTNKIRSFRNYDMYFVFFLQYFSELQICQTSTSQVFILMYLKIYFFFSLNSSNIYRKR